MCGIAGIINGSEKDFTANDIVAMTKIIAHRGPDDEGYCLIDNRNEAFVYGGDQTPAEVYKAVLSYTPKSGTIPPVESIKICLGHRRLSIIDLSPNGHMPMSDKTGRYWIIFNGEIYNYQLIRQELQSLGHFFISQSDTEVILAAYSEWGTSCLQRFNGMWAFAIYDNQNQTIFLARDRFGIKPLYYWINNKGSFCFASEIKQFTVLPGWKATINPQRVYDYLAYSVMDHTEETMFDRVYQIPAGHFCQFAVDQTLSAKNGKVITEKWYKPVYSAYQGNFEAAALEFKKHFKNAIKEHLIADVPLGSSLSGGLDSSAIVCEINEILKEEGKQNLQETFSYIHSNEYMSEQKWIDAVIAKTNLHAHYVHTDGDNSIEHAEDIIWNNDEPTQSQAHVASWQIFKAAKDNHLKVLMSGHGADEYTSGYGAFMKFRWVQLLKNLQFRKLNAEIAQTYAKSKFRTLRAYIGLGYYFVPQNINRYFGRNTKSQKTIQSLISLRHLGATMEHPFDKIPYKPTSILNIASIQLLHFPLQQYLHFDDRHSMAHSVESRVPFLDHRLVEFTTQLPADFLDGLGDTKKIIKYGLEDILPEKIRNRTDKIGFIISEEHWVKFTHTKKYRALLERSISISGGIIKNEALEYFDDVCSNKLPFDKTYWRLIAFGIWIDKFKVSLS